MPALALAHVNFTYPAHRREPARHALRDVTLTIETGQSVALLGPNGSGKSTLIRIITSMLAPGSGEAKLFDRSPHAARETLGVVFQHPGLDRHMTVWENLRDSAALYGVSAAETKTRCDALLNELRLSDRRDALVKTLSGGLARRVDLCRALLAQPRLLILDEPTTGLDPTARREFLDSVLLVPRPSRPGVASTSNFIGGSESPTLLMSTHLIDEAERMDRVLMMHDGRIVADGSPAELRRQIGAQRVTVLDAGWQAPSVDSDRWKSTREGWTRDLDASDSTPTIAHGLASTGAAFSIAPPTLSDVFERVTGTSLQIPDNNGDGAIDVRGRRSKRGRHS